MKGDMVECTGCAMTEARSPSTPPIALAHDSARTTNAGDAELRRATRTKNRRPRESRGGASDAWHRTWAMLREDTRGTRR